MKYNMRKVKGLPDPHRTLASDLHTLMEDIAPGECVELVCTEFDKKTEGRVRAAVSNFSKKWGIHFSCMKADGSNTRRLRFLIRSTGDGG